MALDYLLEPESHVGSRRAKNSMLSFVKPESPNCPPSVETSMTSTTVTTSSTTTASTALVNSYLKSSTCTSPDNSSIENACTSKEIDQL
jgi:hypothetical protein